MDDYYGKEAFQTLHDWLILEHDAHAVCMVGFILKNTLSDNGGVTRGVCKLHQGHGHICDVVETHDIIKTAAGVSAEGVELDPDSCVSMNFWGFPAGEGQAPAYLDLLEKGFTDFFREEVPSAPLKAEYLLPNHIGGFLRAEKVTVKMLRTGDKWYGVTYKEDLLSVSDNFKRLIAEGAYSEDLYSDLLS